MIIFNFLFFLSVFFFFKQKTAYEMRISDWSSDVCSSDLHNDVQEPPSVNDSETNAPENGHNQGPEQEEARVVEAKLPIVNKIWTRVPIDKLPLLDAYIDALIGEAGHAAVDPQKQIGRASCRESVCPYVYVTVVAVSLIQTNTLGKDR